MRYEIILSRKADKFLDKLNTKDYIRIKKGIDKLAANPHPIGMKKLSGSDGLYRIRIGNYRVIYEVIHSKVQVYILNIDHRKDIYKK